MVLYEAQLLMEWDKPDDALHHLSEFRENICDDLAVKELLGKCQPLAPSTCTVTLCPTVALFKCSDTQCVEVTLFPPCSTDIPREGQPEGGTEGIL